MCSSSWQRGEILTDKNIFNLFPNLREIHRLCIEEAAKPKVSEAFAKVLHIQTIKSEKSNQFLHF